MITINVAKSELTELDEFAPDEHILLDQSFVPGGVSVLLYTVTVSPPNPKVRNRTVLFAESQMAPHSRVAVARFVLAEAHDASELHETVAERDVVRIAALGGLELGLGLELGPKS